MHDLPVEGQGADVLLLAEQQGWLASRGLAPGVVTWLLDISPCLSAQLITPHLLIAVHTVTLESSQPVDTDL